MRPIPKKLRQRLVESKEMDECCCCKYDDEEKRKSVKSRRTNIEWNHVWTFAGRQINEIWSLVPLCEYHHRGNNGTITKAGKEASEYESVRKLIDSGFENLSKYQKPMDNTWENLINYYTKYYEKS